MPASPCVLTDNCGLLGVSVRYCFFSFLFVSRSTTSLENQLSVTPLIALFANPERRGPSVSYAQSTRTVLTSQQVFGRSWRQAISRVAEHLLTRQYCARRPILALRTSSLLTNSTGSHSSSGGLMKTPRYCINLLYPRPGTPRFAPRLHETSAHHGAFLSNLLLYNRDTPGITTAREARAHKLMLKLLQSALRQKRMSSRPNVISQLRHRAYGGKPLVELTSQPPIPTRLLSPCKPNEMRPLTPGATLGECLLNREE